MIAIFREFTKSIFAKILLGVLALGMAVWGVEGVFKNQLGNAVITAGSREVSPAEFQRIWNSVRQRREQQTGRPVTPAEMIEANAHRSIAEQLATENSFAHWITTARIKPADSLMADQISKVPEFFNPITNAFDETAFQTFLQRNNISKADFDREIRDQIAVSHFQTGMAMGLRAPRIYTAMQVAYQMERRDITWFPVTPQTAGIPSPPTDAQLTSFINENQDRLRRPEFRQITLVLFRPAHYAQQIVLNEAQVRQIYESRRAQLAQAERRTFTQITLANPAMAPRVVQALRANQDPAAVARAVGGQLVTYTDKPATSVPDAIVARTVFGMTAGQVSDPIRGQLGVAVVKLASVSPGREVSFEEARPDIERALRTEESSERVFNAVQKFEEARAAGATLQAAAQQVGAEMRALPFAVSEGGLTPQGQRVGAPEAVFKAAFALPPGGESDTAEEGGQGAYFVVRVDKVIPSGLPTIAADRAMLSNGWMALEVDKRMRAKAAELAARIAKGESVAAVAASAGASVQTIAGLERGRHPLFGPQLLNEIFLKKSGEGFNNRLGPPNARMAVPPYIVGRVDAIHTPPVGIAARAAEDRRLPASQQIMAEMAELAQTWARNKVKPKINTARVDTLVGVTQPDAPGKKK